MPLIKTKCTCGAPISIDFGALTRAEAEAKIALLDSTPMECPGYHVELSGWRKRWSLDAALEAAYPTRPAILWGYKTDTWTPIKICDYTPEAQRLREAEGWICRAYPAGEQPTDFRTEAESGRAAATACVTVKQPVTHDRVASRWGRHDADCAAHGSFNCDPRCTCGFAAALQAAEPPAPPADDECALLQVRAERATPAPALPQLTLL